MLFIARDYRLNTTVKGGMWCYRCRAGRQEGGTPGDAGNTAQPEPDPWKRTFARVGNCGRATCQVELVCSVIRYPN